MRTYRIGEFEELVLLMVGILHDEAYGVAVTEALTEHAGRSAKISAVHSALHRLQKKGYLTSRVGGATAERGGRRKRFFELTPSGKAALQARRTTRERLWGMLPDLALPGHSA